MKIESCDVLIVGAGPAGMASAVELLKSKVGRVMILDKGRPIHKRVCKALSNGLCQKCQECQLLTGVGGASGILGGKLCFFPAGELLARHIGISTDDANSLVFSFFKQNGLIPLLNLERGAISNGHQYSSSIVNYKNYFAKPLLRPVLQRLFYRLCTEISSLGGVIKTNSNVIDICPSHAGSKFKVIYAQNGERKTVSVRKTVIVATGRSSVFWLSNLINRLGIDTLPSNFDIGVRLEFPSSHVKNIPPSLQDLKIKINEGTPSEVRTLCWCRGGELSTVNVGGMSLVDGHFGNKWYPFTSVSIVSRLPLPIGHLPFNYFFELLNGFVPEIPLSQNLMSFLGKNCSSAKIHKPRLTSKEMNLRYIFNNFILHGLTQMLEELNSISGGKLLDSNNSFVYGPVIDKFWSTPKLNSRLMSDISGLYFAGDVTGRGRGIIQGLLSGIVVARNILNNNDLINSELLSKKFMPVEKS